MAFPRCTIHSPPQSPKTLFFEKLLACIEAEQPHGIVVGLPLLDDGSESLTTRQVRNFAARLQRRCAIPLYFMPEFLSSEEAKADLWESNLRGKKHKDVLDQQAAVRILQSFLSETDTQKEQRKI